RRVLFRSFRCRVARYQPSARGPPVPAGRLLDRTQRSRLSPSWSAGRTTQPWRYANLPGASQDSHFGRTSSQLLFHLRTQDRNELLQQQGLARRRPVPEGVDGGGVVDDYHGRGHVGDVGVEAGKAAAARSFITADGDEVAGVDLGERGV